jgi:hypothetical protein
VSPDLLFKDAYACAWPIRKVTDFSWKHKEFHTGSKRVTYIFRTVLLPMTHTEHVVK